MRYSKLVSACLAADSYMFSHFAQQPPKTQFIRAYMTARGGPYANVLTFWAQQMLLTELFADPITKNDIDEAESIIKPHMGVFNRKGFERIVNVHGGYIPLRIRTVPEAGFIPLQNAMVTFENTDPELPWVTDFYQTAFFPWYPATIATQSNHCRRIILSYLERTGTPEAIDFKLHDFGYRGTTDAFVGWQAAVGGLAHLINFKGTDTIPALIAANRFYLMDRNKPAGFSIPAAMHSTVTTWMALFSDRQVGEVQAYDNMLNQYPTGLVAVVSDSDNIYNACEKLWGETLRDKVLARDGVLIIRPDSGDPCEVVMKCLRILDAKFGSYRNQKGYIVLNDKVRVIQGDGVNPVSIDKILAVMEINGYSADNIAFGMGGALLQKVDRDTLSWAIKTMSFVHDGHELDVFKNPVTQKGKQSKGGNLTLYNTPKGYVTQPRVSVDTQPGPEVLQIVYENGRIYAKESIYGIYDRVRAAERYLAKQTVAA